MTLFQNKYRVESNRLRGYDYSSIGAYFITICTIGRGHFFGEIFDAEMVLNPLGKYTHQCWTDIPQHFPFVTIDEFVVMPNHVHGIIIITEETNNHSSRTMANPDAITEETNNEETNNHSSRTMANPDAITKETNNEETNDHSSLQSSTSLSFPMSLSSPSPVPFRSPSKTVGSIVRGFKIGVTKWARQNSNIHDIWQPNYHDRIIKNERALNAIRNYIRNNPRKWRDE